MSEIGGTSANVIAGIEQLGQPRDYPLLLVVVTLIDLKVTYLLNSP